MKNKRKKTNNKKLKRIQETLPFPYYVYMIPVFIVIVVLPLMVHGDIFETDEMFSNVSLINGAKGIDVFLHCKVIVLYYAVGISLFFMLCFLLSERNIIIKDRLLLLIFVYLLLGILSSVHSRSITVAWFGGEDMFQGMFSIIAYILLFYYTYYVSSYEKDKGHSIIKYFLRSIRFVSLLLCVFVTLQICGKDPFRWQWIQKICNIENAQIVSGDEVYLTLYNPNYVGVVTLMFFPFMIAGGKLSDTIKNKLLYYIAGVGLFVAMVASGSKTALSILLGMAVVMTVLLLVKYRNRYKKGIIFLCVGIVVALILMTVYSFIKQTNLLSQFLVINTPIKDWKNNLTGLSTSEEGVQFNINGDGFSYKCTESEIFFSDDEGNRIVAGEAAKKQQAKYFKSIKKSNFPYSISDENVPQRLERVGFEDIIFSRADIVDGDNNISGILFLINGQLWFFTNKLNDGKYYYLNHMGRFTDCENAQDAFPVSWYGFASYRGYIWSKTIPLLKNTLLLGVGSNHFSLEFPNHDYAAKARIGKLSVLYNKPHNWYLQMAVETGMCSAICMILFLIFIKYRGFCLIKSNFVSGTKDIIFLMCADISVSGYILAMLLNDSMMVSAPVFWVVLGIYAGWIRRIKMSREI